MAGRDVLLRALDGYTRPVAGDRLLEDGGYLALRDAERAAGFAPLDRRQVDPGPFYVVWEGDGRNDTTAWPWPYQLAELALDDFAASHPHTVPVGAGSGSAAARGYRIFRRQCASCHAINGEGGKVGPDLNVPRSIVEYRPEPQIRAFVRNPASFRYTSMPAHPGMTEAELDDLLAYLRHIERAQARPGSRGALNARTREGEGAAPAAGGPLSSPPSRPQPAPGWCTGADER